MLITTAGDTIAKSYVRAPFDRTPEIVAGSGLENEALTKLLDDLIARHRYLNSIGIADNQIVNLEYHDYARSKYLALGMRDTMP